MSAKSLMTNPELTKLKEKERQSYIALSALIDLLQGQQKHSHEYKQTTDFDLYKRETLMRATRLTFKDCEKRPGTQENQFNLMHYQRAILTASKSNYRNMAILAARHNLTGTAQSKLLHLIKKSCIKLSKEIKLLEQKLQQAELAQTQETNTNPGNAIILPVQLESVI